MVLIGSIDQGTSSSRFLVFDGSTGNVIASHQKEVNHITPNEGWLEQDPEEIYQSVVYCIESCLSKIEDKISRIGITNQRESTVIWDSNTGKALANAIIWCDGRTETTVNKMLGKCEKDKYFLQKKTGLPLSTYFSALKVKWLIDNVPEVKIAVENGTAAFGTIDSWIIYKLTGNHSTDATNASRTMLYNLYTNSWDNELLEFFEIPSLLKLPKIQPSSSNFGAIESLSCLKGVEITGVLGDQQAALVGQQCLSTGELKNTYGTGCFLLQNTSQNLVFSKNGLLTTVAYQKSNGELTYAVEGSIAIAGLLIRWLRDNIGIINSIQEIETLAKEVDSTAG